MKLTLISFYMVLSIGLMAQEREQKVNQVDSLSQKHGLWVNDVSSYTVDSMYYRHGKLHGPFKSFFKNGNLRYKGEYAEGQRVGVWQTYDKEILVAEEVSRGINTETVRHELGYELTPKFFSYVKLYHHKTGQLKREGKVLYEDSWESDASRKHDQWIYFQPEGDTASIKFFEYGRLKREIKKH